MRKGVDGQNFIILISSNTVKIILKNFYQIRIGIYGENKGLVFHRKNWTIAHNL